MRKTIYRFGDFELNPSERILRRHGVLVPLPPKAIATLLVLLEADGRVVPKAELLEAVWPGTFVEEASLPQAISVLRKGLEPGFPESSPIETIARVGYMFRAPVTFQQVPDIEPPETVTQPELQPEPEPILEKPSRPTASSGKLWIALAAAIVLTAAGFAVWVSLRPRPFLARSTTLVPLTTANGWEVDPAISPDGKLLAYASRREGDTTYSLWVKPLFGAEGAKCVLTAAYDAIHPAWSPDQKQLAFLARGTGNSSGIALLDLATGSARLLKTLPYWDPVAHTPLTTPEQPGPVWMPGSRSLLYAQWNLRDRTSLALVDIHSGKTDLLLEAPPQVADSQPAISPDGRRIAFLRRNLSTIDIVVFDLKSRKLTTLQAHWGAASGLAWDPGGQELLTTSDHDSTAWTIWRVPLHGRPIRADIPSPRKPYQPVFSPNGKVMAFTAWDESTTLQLVPDLSSKQPPRVLYPAAQGVAQTDVSKDGKQIAFVSDRGGHFEVWLAPVDGSPSTQPVQLTHGLNVGSANSVAWSPDGQTLALGVRIAGDNKCELVSTRTGRIAPLQLPGAEQFGCTVPMFSDDGRWVYVYVQNDRGLATYKVSADAVPYAEEMKGVLSDALFFENDPWQYSVGPHGVGLFRSRIGETDSKPEPIRGLENVHFASNWILQDGGILFMDRRKPNPPLQRYDPKTGSIVELTAPLDRPVYDLDFSYRPREHYLIYTKYREGAGTQIYALTHANP